MEIRLRSIEMIAGVMRKYANEHHRKLIDMYFDTYYNSFEEFKNTIQGVLDNE